MATDRNGTEDARADTGNGKGGDPHEVEPDMSGRKAAANLHGEAACGLQLAQPARSGCDGDRSEHHCGVEAALDRVSSCVAAAP